MTAGWRGLRVDFLQKRRDWQQRGGVGSGETFTEFVKRKEGELAQDVVSHIEGLPASERAQAIHDVATLLRNNSVVKYGGHADLKIWEDLKSNVDTQHAFASEAVRELAHYANERTNSETSYLKTLDPPEHDGRSRFYNRMALQIPAEEFGPQLADWVRRLATGVKARKSVVP